MRNAFIEYLITRVEQDPSVFLVVGDLGYTVIDPLVAKHPDRFLNAGVAEQNMTAVAAGLAREGFKVFTYSIANFTTLRCLEQIRNDVCYHDLPVCVVSVGGGFMYGYLGPTHHATEDIGILRALPGMRVFVPFSKASVQRAVDEVLATPGPAYIRLGREGLAVNNVQDNGLTLVQAHPSAQGRAFISIGQIGKDTVAAAQSAGADLFALCRISPLPEEQLRTFFEKYSDVTVVEDHQEKTGAFSALSEFTSRLKGINIRGMFSPVIDGEDGQRRAMLFDPGAH